MKCAGGWHLLPTCVRVTPSPSSPRPISFSKPLQYEPARRRLCGLFARGCFCRCFWLCFAPGRGPALALRVPDPFPAGSTHPTPFTRGLYAGSFDFGRAVTVASSTQAASKLGYFLVNLGPALLVARK